MIGRNVACVERMRTVQFFSQPVGKTPHRRPSGWKDNIKMNLRQIKWEGVDCMYLAQNRDQQWALVNMAINLWVSQCSYCLD
jgi:hypothetical protein